MRTVCIRRARPSEPLLCPLWVRDGRPQRVLVFFPVGRFYEFYGSQALEAHSALGLRLVTGLRGFREGCGFHRRWLGRYLPRALACGYHVALIKDEKGVDGVVHRRLAKLFAARTDQCLHLDPTLQAVTNCGLVVARNYG